MALLLLLALALSHGDVLRIAVAGDVGGGSSAVAAGISRVHAERPLDAIILTGDNFYPCGVTSEHDPRWSIVLPLTRVGVPVFPVLSNHDYCGDADPNAQIGAPIENWRFPAREYTVRTRFADFFFLETQRVVRGAALGELPSSDKPWQIAVGHHPILSSGYHGYFPRSEVRRMRAVLPALTTAGVDVYLCGHDHHLELIRGKLLFLVSGAGSAPIPPVKLRLRTVFPERVGRETIGFAVLEITQTAINVRFYDAEGKPRSEWLSGRVRRDALAE